MSSTTSYEIAKNATAKEPVTKALLPPPAPKMPIVNLSGTSERVTALGAFNKMVDMFGRMPSSFN